MILQDDEYPNWAPNTRASYRGNIRIYLFWSITFILCTVVITCISTDAVNWDTMGNDFTSTNETTRGLLAAVITFMDLTIVMQDWEFPTFVTNQNIKLPGLDTYEINWKFLDYLSDFFTIHITGKWFNYGIITCVMMLDLNMLKNQVVYDPIDFAQYTGPDDRIYTVTDPAEIAQFLIDPSNFTYELRQGSGDLKMNSRYVGHSGAVKMIAIVPVFIVAIMFFTLLKLEDPTREELQAQMKREATVRGETFGFDPEEALVLAAGAEDEEEKEPAMVWDDEAAAKEEAV